MKVIISKMGARFGTTKNEEEGAKDGCPRYWTAAEARTVHDGLLRRETAAGALAGAGYIKSKLR